MLDDQLVTARNAIVRYLVESGNMPSMRDVALALSTSEQEAAQLLKELHNEHALLLNEEGSILMLWPFSGVPTPFQVIANGRSYWANCAWDSIGIPAALHTDAVIHSSFAYPNEPVTLKVQNDRVIPDAYFVHFPLPVRHWYDDLRYT